MVEVVRGKKKSKKFPWRGDNEKKGRERLLQELSFRRAGAVDYRFSPNVYNVLHREKV